MDLVKKWSYSGNLLLSCCTYHQRLRKEGLIKFQRLMTKLPLGANIALELRIAAFTALLDNSELFHVFPVG